MSDYQIFLANLPVEFVLLGWRIGLKVGSNGKVGFEIVGEADALPKSFPLTDWKWMAFHHKKHGFQAAAHDELLPFFTFYLNCSVGMRVLTFGSHERTNEQRIQALAYSFDAWRKTTGPRTRDGRLQKSLFCIAYAETESARLSQLKTCCARTKSPNGLCRHHDHPDTKTLWNFEPFSQLDSQIEAWRDHVVEQGQRIAEQAQKQPGTLPFERAQRETRWQQVASELRYTATDRQIFFLLDLGVTPSELNGITKEQASDLIDQKLSESRSAAIPDWLQS